jgi:hypothetical protein
MYNLGTAANTNEFQQLLGMKTMQEALPYLGDTRNTISSYADSPMLAYQPDNWQQSMQSYQNPIDRQLSYKLKDIGSSMGREYHSFARKAAQAGAQSDATNQLANISTSRLSNERNQQAGDWNNALNMQQQARGLDIGSLLGMITAQTNQTNVTPPSSAGGMISNIGSLVGGIGSQIGSMAGNQIGSAVNTGGAK